MVKWICIVCKLVKKAFYCFFLISNIFHLNQKKMPNKSKILYQHIYRKKSILNGNMWLHCFLIRQYQFLPFVCIQHIIQCVNCEDYQFNKIVVTMLNDLLEADQHKKQQTSNNQWICACLNIFFRVRLNGCDSEEQAQCHTRSMFETLKTPYLPLDIILI